MSNFFRRVALTAFIAVAFFSVGLSPAKAITVEELQAQIAVLLAQLAQLQGNFNNGQSNLTLHPSAQCPSENTRYGSTDATTGGQVSRLQNFLVNHYVLNRGDYVTGYFGRGTQGLVSRFEADNGLPVTGWVNERTLSKIGALCADKYIGVVSLDSPSYLSSGKGLNITGTGKDVGELYMYVSRHNLGGDVDFKTLEKLSGGKEDTYRSDVNVINGKWSTWFDIEASRPGETFFVYVFKVTSLRLPLLFNQIQVSPRGSDNGSIRVTSPNGGEQWEIGQLNTITWAPYGYNPDVNPASQVIVELIKKPVLCPVGSEKCPDFTVVGRIMDTGKASLHTYFNINEYNTWAQPGQYYVRVRNDLKGTMDMSDAPFTLLPRSVDLKINNSDMPVTASDNQSISLSWTTANYVFSNGCTLSGVRNAPGGGFGPFHVAANGSGTYYAYAPVSGAYSSVQLSCTDGAKGLTHTDYTSLISSGATPTASLRVISPNGGESIAVSDATQVKIAWRMESITTPVSIALYKNDQWLFWIEKTLHMDKSLDGTYSYVWVPNAKGPALPNVSIEGNSGYKIYITGQKSDGTGYVDDKSDAPFAFSGTQAVPVKTQSCAPNFATGTVWGSDVYTADSNVCSAALHAGVILRASGGSVTYEIRPGQSSYTGSSRNGISSSNLAGSGASIVFTSPQVPASPLPTGTLTTTNCVIPAGVATSTCTFYSSWTTTNIPESTYIPYGSQNGGIRLTFTPQGGTAFNMLNDGSPSSYSNMTGNWGAGTHMVRLYDSRTNALLDSKQVLITVAPELIPTTPNITAGAVTIPATVTVGTPATFSSVITNSGAATTGGFPVIFFVYSQPASGSGTSINLPGQDSPALGAGATRTITQSHTFTTAGAYSVRLCVNKLGQYTSATESTNCGPWKDVVVGSGVSVSSTNVLPVGNIEAGNCSFFQGWAYDPDSSSTSIGIIVKEGDVTRVSGTANMSRDDVNLLRHITGSHGFNIPTPASLKDGAAHIVRIYGLDTSSGLNELASGPRTITCSSTSTTTAQTAAVIEALRGILLQIQTLVQ